MILRNDYCKDCKYYPDCDDLDDDTEVFDCGYKKVTRDDFIIGYCERSGISWDRLRKSQVVLPCSCGEEDCQGWAMISNGGY